MTSAAFDEEALRRARAVRIEDELRRRGITLRGRTEREGPCPKCGGKDRFSITSGTRSGTQATQIQRRRATSSVWFNGSTATILDRREQAGRRPTKANGQGPLGPESPPPEPGDYGAEAPARAAAQRHQITKTYDYRDADGALIYQVCRQEWIEDGKRQSIPAAAASRPRRRRQAAKLDLGFI